MRERERERERETETERQRETETETERDRDRERERQRERQTDRQTDRQRQTGRQRHTDRQIKKDGKSVSFVDLTMCAFAQRNTYLIFLQKYTKAYYSMQNGLCYFPLFFPIFPIFYGLVNN